MTMIYGVVGFLAWQFVISPGGLLQRQANQVQIGPTANTVVVRAKWMESANRLVELSKSPIDTPMRAEFRQLFKLVGAATESEKVALWKAACRTDAHFNETWYTNHASTALGVPGPPCGLFSSTVNESPAESSEPSVEAVSLDPALEEIDIPPGEGQPAKQLWF
jgi:hypothetical protein